MGIDADSSPGSGSFFTADWLSPLDFIRNLVGLEGKEASAEAPLLVGESCHEELPAVTSNLDADTECLFQQAEQELLETVAAELRQEEEFCQKLLRGPSAMSQFDEEGLPEDEKFPKGSAVINQSAEDAFSEIERYLARRREEESAVRQSEAALTKDALRQQAKETLSDGFATGCFDLALAKLKLSRESPEMTSLRRLTKETLCVSATNGGLKAALAKVKHARSGIAVPVVSWDHFGRSLDLASKREEVRQEVREAVVETELPIEQPKATVEAAPTKSKKRTEDDDDQHDTSPNGFVPARMIATSPMKGKKRASPKKGGS